MKKIVAIVLLIFISGCSSKNKESVYIPDPQFIAKDKIITGSNKYNYQKVLTIEHEGHYYIIHDSGYGSSMIHSAGCPCRENFYDD